MSLDGWSVKRHTDKRCDELEKYLLLLGKKLILLEEKISSLEEKPKKVASKVSKKKVKKVAVGKK
tara:strand:+ start:178 stop:372 length:195 start_codon:yes stop_codon:yes gene_type:complete